MYIAQPRLTKKTGGSQPFVEPEPEKSGVRAEATDPVFLAGDFGERPGF